MTKISNSFIDDFIKDKNFIRKSNYEKSSVNMSFECLSCKNEWKTTWSIIRSGSGCPKCSNNGYTRVKRVTNEIFDERISSLKIKRTEDYRSSKKSIGLECLECGYKFRKIANAVARSVGCPRCNNTENLHTKKRNFGLTANEIKKLFDENNKEKAIKFICEKFNNPNANIIDIETISSSVLKTRIVCKCVKPSCLFEWKTKINIYRNGHGCPRCKGGGNAAKRLSNEEVDRRIKNRPIRRIGNYKNARTRIEFECLKCGRIWMTFPASILNGSGCDC